MLDRELTYQMPFERLSKLGLRMSLKAYANSWRLAVVLFAGYLAAMALIIAFARPINAWLAQYGLPEATPIASIVLASFLGVWLLQRYGKQQLKQRADFDSTVRFSEQADGLKLATPEIEYFIKWHGISQMMLLPDGVVFSHGNIFFLVPDEAFRDTGERDTLARDVFGRLNPAARERSEKFVQPVLAAAAGTART